MICADPELSALDDKLADVHHKALEAAADKKGAQQRQREWLTQKRDVCREAKCLKNEYKKRISQLEEEYIRVDSDAVQIRRYIGKYRRPGFTSCFKPGPSGTDVPSRCEIEDTLAITPRIDGKYDVEFSIVGANFHECAMSGIAYRSENTLRHQFELESFGSAGPAKKCVLIFEFDKYGVVLKADPKHPECKRQYCGERANYNGARFGLNEKQQ
jgi:hypothetical protein